jgi:hypothetical protein
MGVGISRNTEEEEDNREKTFIVSGDLYNPTCVFALWAKPKSGPVIFGAV